ncbi:hypothetical protein BGX31_008719 [Mortierella sp. GBA43]|nr:hypothetical protein BGX31_008719 [Mortierella sp. GBA43]
MRSLAYEFTTKTAPEVDPQVDPEIESASLEAGSFLRRLFGEGNPELSVMLLSIKLAGFSHLAALLRLVSDCPAQINPDTHVEWKESDLGILGLFDEWIKPGLQMVWTLLLADVIFMNPTQSLRGLVVETYDRDHQRDCFAEHRDKKTPLSTPDELSRYKLIKVSSRPAMYGNPMITLGTKQMNAIFTKVILQVHGGPERTLDSPLEQMSFSHRLSRGS